jgi:hypothetical protein
MRQRGRKSLEALSIVPTAIPQRPEPPEELSLEQADVWRAYVGRMPADWFTVETWPILTHLCGLVTNSRLLRRELREFERGIPKHPEGFERYRQIQKMYESEGQAIATLSTKLRLTPQSKNDPHRAEKDRTAIANASSLRKPWD